MKYTFTCEQGHDPETFTVEAESEEEAVEKMMQETQGHVAEKHPEMANMSPEEAKNVIKSGLKAEG